MAALSLTEDEVMARSRHVFSGMTCWCWNCDRNWALVEMPCLKHCESDEERAERDRRFGLAIDGKDWRGR